MIWTLTQCFHQIGQILAWLRSRSPDWKKKIIQVCNLCQFVQLIFPWFTIPLDSHWKKLSFQFDVLPRPNCELWCLSKHWSDITICEAVHHTERKAFLSKLCDCVLCFILFDFLSLLDSNGNIFFFVPDTCALALTKYALMALPVIVSRFPHVVRLWDLCLCHVLEWNNCLRQHKHKFWQTKMATRNTMGLFLVYFLFLLFIGVCDRTICQLEHVYLKTTQVLPNMGMEFIMAGKKKKGRCSGFCSSICSLVSMIKWKNYQNASICVRYIDTKLNDSCDDQFSRWLKDSCQQSLSCFCSQLGSISWLS